MEDRDELGRWVIDSRGPGTGPRAGRVESLSNRYSDEAASPRVVDIIQRMLRAMHECVRSEGGVSSFPAVGGWERFKPAHLSRADAMLHFERVVEAEDSSSGSDTALNSDSEGTVDV